MPVGYAPGFCSCGNPVRVTCQLCQVAMCEDCDVLSGPVADLASLPVLVVGFGYLNRAWDYRYTELGLRPTEGAAYGPFLYLTEVLSSLSAAHGLGYRNGAGPVRHLCWPCLHTAIPDTAQRIAAGLMCETPRCVHDPCERCRCCRGAFCEQCLTLTRPRGMVPCRITWQDPAVRPRRGDPGLIQMGAALERSVVPAALHGLCGICGSERLHRQREMAREVARTHYAGLLEPVTGTGAANQDGPGAVVPDNSGAGHSGSSADQRTLVLRLPAIKHRTRKGQDGERERAREIIDGCVAELTDYLRRLPVAPCQRPRAFAEGLDFAYYALLDERGQTAPAAAPRP
jgi:hypothetical protein